MSLEVFDMAPRQYATLVASLGLFVSYSIASHAFYVGKNLTSDGSVMVGGTGEEVSSHWLQIFPAKDHAANATITVGVTEDAVQPGLLIAIPQVPHTFRYLSMEYSDFEGFPAPLTNGGVNEKGVAVRDVWAANRDELYNMTPNPQLGLQYSDLARVVLERATTAREGVEIMGDMIAKYGYADYGGNSHLIADADEGWVVWEFAGGEKLWAAERLESNEVRVFYPGYIEDFPISWTGNPDYMGSSNLVSFAVEQGWFHPENETFNIFKIYGVQGPDYTARNGGFKYMSQAQLEDATLAMVPVTEEDLIKRVRDPRISDDEAGYGQVLSLHPNMDPDMIRIWVAPTGSVTAPYVPWWLGAQDNAVPPEFGEHRYLTKDAASTFLNPDYQLQEASLFAGRLFKRVLYYTCSNPDAFLPTVTTMIAGFENQSRSDLGWVEKSAQTLISAGQRETARELLAFYSQTRAGKAMDMGKAMVDGLDSYIKLANQWKAPVGSKINDANEGAETVNCLVGINPDQPPNKQQGVVKRRSRTRTEL
ncbi:dipeptidase domain-containing protein [Amylocarpus encephaloides]|uniref:Dipeptidase domain-containing protein n=1 Tax=Amylocarpus encephaloides TaxID=45428 RepID=A0A9P7YAK0_9HELO|nr:dipeptidase domain-containing protein [Amylocarpus encephaloides]